MCDSHLMASGKEERGCNLVNGKIEQPAMRVLTIYLVIVHPLEEEKFFGLSWRRELEFSHFGAPPKKMTCSLSLPFGRRRCGLKGWMEFLSPAFSLSLSLSRSVDGILGVAAAADTLG